MTNRENFIADILVRIDREAKLSKLFDEEVDQEWIDKQIDIIVSTFTDNLDKDE